MEVDIKHTHEDADRKACPNDATKLHNRPDLQTDKIFLQNRRKTHMCSYCGFATRHKEGLKLHIKAIHHKIRDKICDMCGYSASHDTLLKQHVKLVHEKIKNNVCESCGYKTSKKQNLQSHIKAVHEKLKDKSCSLCDYSTSSDSNLKKHMKIVHDKVKDKVCNICGHSTSLNSDLRKHMKVVHKVVMKAQKETKYTPSSYLDSYSYISDTNPNLKDDIKPFKLGFAVKKVNGGETKQTVHQPMNEVKSLTSGVSDNASGDNLCDAVNTVTRQAGDERLEMHLGSLPLSLVNHGISTNSKPDFNYEILTLQSKQLKTENGEYSDNENKIPVFPEITRVDDLVRYNLEDVDSDEISSISKLANQQQPEEGDKNETFDYLIINCSEDNFQEISNFHHCQSVPKKIFKLKKRNKEHNGLCSKYVSSKYKRRKRNVPEQKCKLCSYSTSCTVNLNRHVNVVHCDIKDMEKVNDAQKVKHMCDSCTYVTTRVGHLRRHKKSVHQKAKDKSCSQCSYATSDEGNLKKHIKAVHEKIKDQICDICGFSTTDYSGLKKHIKEVHDKIKDKICSLCGFTTARNAELKHHIKSIHDKIKDKICETCGYATTDNSNLRKHIKKVHNLDKLRLSDTIENSTPQSLQNSQSQDSITKTSKK